MGKRVVLYRRVSTGKQKDNFSLPMQLEEMQAYCAKKGYEIVADFEEVETGRYLEERDQLDAAIKLIERHNAEILLVYKQDRLSRDQQHLEIIIYRVFRAKGSIEFVHGDQIDNTETGIFMRNVTGFFSAMEVRHIRDRTMTGRRGRANKGLPNFGKHAPYGYLFSGNVLSFDPVTEPIMRRFLREVRNHIPMVRIAHQFNLEGIPTPADYTRMRNGLTPKGYKWSQGTLHHLLANPIYRGKYYIWRWHTTNEQIIHPLTGKVSRKVTAIDQLATPLSEEEALQPIEIETPAMMTESEYLDIQAILAENKERAARGNRHPELAWTRRFVFCGYCNEAMIVQNHILHQKNVGRRQIKRYICKHQKYFASREKCPNGTSISADALDAFVWTEVRRLVKQPEFGRLFFREGVEEQEMDTFQVVDNLERQLKQVDSDRRGIIKSMGRYPDDETMQALFADQIRELNQNYRETERKLHIAQNDHLSRERRARRNQEVEEWLDAVQVEMATRMLTHEEIQTLYHGLGVRVTVWRDEHDPHCRVELIRHERVVFAVEQRGILIPASVGMWDADVWAMIQQRARDAAEAEDNEQPGGRAERAALCCQRLDVSNTMHTPVSTQKEASRIQLPPALLEDFA